MLVAVVDVPVLVVVEVTVRVVTVNDVVVVVRVAVVEVYVVVVELVLLVVLVVDVSVVVVVVGHFPSPETQSVGPWQGFPANHGSTKIRYDLSEARSHTELHADCSSTQSTLPR